MEFLAYSDSRIYSGAEAVFVEVCEGLVRSGMRMTCATAVDNAQLRKALARECSDSDFLDVPAQGPRVAAVQLWEPRRLTQLRRTLGNRSWQVMLVNLPSAEYGSAVALALHRDERPIVGLLHVHHSPRTEGFRLGALRERLARPAMARFDHIHVVSPFGVRETALAWRLPGERISHMPLPRPTVEPLARDDARRRLGLPQDQPVLGLVGRLSVRQKGHDVLLAALPEVLRATPGITVMVAGDGSDRAAIQAEAQRRGVAHAVRLVGNVRPVSVALSACDLVVIPSRFEGLPLVALEAIVAGVPGVATDVDGLRAVWPQRWRVPPDDPPALARAIVRLLAAGAEEISEGLAEGHAAVNRYTSAVPSETIRMTFDTLTAAAT